MITGLTKLTSGRFIFMVAAAIVFVRAAWGVLFTPEMASAIVILVANFYFTRKRDEK